jgi:hypothetical protein
MNPSRSLVILSPDIFIDPIEAQFSSGPETVHVVIEKKSVQWRVEKENRGKQEEYT